MSLLNKHRISIFTILLIVLLSTCRKKADPPAENLGFFSLGEAKDYLLFKPGTWWVYKNSYTNELDTMILTSCAMDTVHAESKIRFFDYEAMGFGILSKRDNAYYSSPGSSMNADASTFSATWSWECQRIGGYHLMHTTTPSTTGSGFFYPFDKSKRGNGVYETTFDDRKDSLIVGGKTYYDIVSFSVYFDGAYPYPNIYIYDFSNSMYYWAKGFGLIKIELQSIDANKMPIAMNWELIESHIFK